MSAPASRPLGAAVRAIPDLAALIFSAYCGGIMPGRSKHAYTMDAPIRLSVDVTTGDVELIRAAYSSRLSSVIDSSLTRLPPRSSRAFMLRNVATSLRTDVDTAVEPPLRAGDNPGTSNLSSTHSGYAAEHAGHTFRSMPQGAHILRFVENARSGTACGTQLKPQRRR